VIPPLVRRGRKQWLAGVTALVALAAPTVATACPACATRSNGGAAVFTWVALMIAVPYVIVAVTIRTIRKLEREP
jgi:hypothetical protein